MSYKILAFPKNYDGKIELTEEELQKLLNEAYSSVYTEAKNPSWYTDTKGRSWSTVTTPAIVILDDYTVSPTVKAVKVVHKRIYTPE
jgi:hypothetical protein